MSVLCTLSILHSSVLATVMGPRLHAFAQEEGFSISLGWLVSDDLEAKALLQELQTYQRQKGEEEPSFRVVNHDEIDINYSRLKDMSSQVDVENYGTLTLTLSSDMTYNWRGLYNDEGAEINFVDVREDLLSYTPLHMEINHLENEGAISFFTSVMAMQALGTPQKEWHLNFTSAHVVGGDITVVDADDVIVLTHRGEKQNSFLSANIGARHIHINGFETLSLTPIEAPIDSPMELTSFILKQDTQRDVRLQGKITVLDHCEITGFKNFVLEEGSHFVYGRQTHIGVEKLILKDKSIFDYDGLSLKSAHEQTKKEAQAPPPSFIFNSHMHIEKGAAARIFELKSQATQASPYRFQNDGLLEISYLVRDKKSTLKRQDVNIYGYEFFTPSSLSKTVIANGTSYVNVLHNRGVFESAPSVVLNYNLKEFLTPPRYLVVENDLRRLLIGGTVFTAGCIDVLLPCFVSNLLPLHETVKEIFWHQSQWAKGSIEFYAVNEDGCGKDAQGQVNAFFKPQAARLVLTKPKDTSVPQADSEHKAIDKNKTPLLIHADKSLIIKARTVRVDYTIGLEGNESMCFILAGKTKNSADITEKDLADYSQIRGLLRTPKIVINSPFMDVKSSLLDVETFFFYGKKLEWRSREKPEANAHMHGFMFGVSQRKDKNQTVRKLKLRNTKYVYIKSTDHEPLLLPDLLNGVVTVEVEAPHITIVDSLLLDKNEGTLLLKADGKLKVDGPIAAAEYLQLVGAQIEFTNKARMDPTQVLSLYATHPGQEVILPATLSRNGSPLNINVLSLQTSRGTLVMDVQSKGKRLYISSDTLTLMRPCLYEEGLIDIKSHTYIRNILTGDLEIRTPYANLKKSTLKGPMIIKTGEIDIQDTLLQSDHDRFMHISANQIEAANSVIEGLHQWKGAGEGARAKLENVDASAAHIEMQGMSLDVVGNTKIGNTKIDQHTYIAPDAKLEVDHIKSQETLQSLKAFGTFHTKQKVLQLKAEKDILIRNLKRTLEEGSEVDFVNLVLVGDNVEVNGAIHSQNLSFEARKELLLKQATLMGQVFALKAGLQLKAKEASLKAENNITIRAHEANLTPTNIETHTISIHLDQYNNGIEGVIALAHDLVNCDSVHLDARNESLIIKRPTNWRPNISLRVNELEINSQLTSKGNMSLEAETIAPIRCQVIKANDFHLTANHGDINFYKSVLDVMGDLAIIAGKGSIKEQGTTLTAGNNINAIAFQDFEGKSFTRRTHQGESYHDTVHKSMYKAGGSIKIDAFGNIHFIGLHTQSAGDTTFKTPGLFVDEALAWEWQSVYRDSETYSRRKTRNYVLPTHEAKQDISISSGAALLQAPQITAHSGTIEALNGGVDVQNVQSIYEHEYEYEDEGFFSSETVKSHTCRVTSIGALFNFETPFGISSAKDIVIKHAHFQCPKVTLDAMSGVVRLLQGENQYSYAYQCQSSNVVWQSMEVHQEYHKTFSPCVFDGEIEINSPELFIERVEGKTLQFLDKLAAYKGNIAYETLKEIHDVVHKEQSGPSAALAAIVAIAISLVTYGAGTTAATANFAAMEATVVSFTGVAAGSTAANVLTAMALAAKASLYTSAALALLNCNGDLGKAAKAFASSNTLKSMSTAMATAGLTKGFGAHFKINTNISSFTSITDHFQYQALQSGVGLAMDMATGHPIDKAFADRLVACAVNTSAGYVANQIGQGYKLKDIDAVWHKCLHAALGGTSAALLNMDDAGRAAVSGAFGACMAEIIADTLGSENTILEKAQAKEKEIGRILTPEEFSKLENIIKDDAYNWARFSTLTTAMLVNLDVHIADHAATNAMDNNLIPLLIYGGMAISTAYNIYTFFSILKTQGLVAACQNLGIDLLTTFAGGALARGGTFIAGKILAKNPLMQKLLSSQIDKLGKIVDKFIEKFSHTPAGSALLNHSKRILAVGGRAEQAILDVEKKLLDKARSAYHKTADRLRGSNHGLDVGKSAPSVDVSKSLQALDLADKKAVKKIHGNSRHYVGDTHVYVIRDANGKLYKVGESTQGVNKFGQSKRAQQQVKKLRKETNENFKSEIRAQFPNKAEARQWETGTIERYRKLFGTDKLPGNKGNR